MNTTDILAIVAPHAEMLKRMGWTIEADPSVSYNVLVMDADKSMGESVGRTLAARILSDVCMEWLEKWASNMVAVVNVWYDDLGNDQPWHASTTNRKHPVFSRPTRLAALLALCAWCKEVKG